MLLSAATISGFKSFRKPVEILFSDRTSVLIGPNDQGKTNVLLAVERLAPDKQFDREDINDRVNDDAAHITYQFTLTDSELTSIETGIRQLLEQELNRTAEHHAESSAKTLGELDAVAESPIQQWVKDIQTTRKIEFVRHVGRSLDLRAPALAENVRVALCSVLSPLVPKVFLFSPDVLRQLPDTVTLLSLECNEVMQGVFRLAGIWDLRRELLSGNTRQNHDKLREASEALTTEIRKSWSQGKDLQFYLEYVGNDIRLTVKDIAKTLTAVAERSDGFTAYFAMRMLLVARTDQAKPNGYIFLFDEPGLNLHPKGQVDLQNVFEDIARTNQIVYSTHSVFLINKNFPERNHLIYKNEHGSSIDNKPFVGGWAKVKEHLDLYLSANFLFADKVLLTEGTTDEIYVPLILQGLIERGRFDGDLNSLAIRNTVNSREMLTLASMYIQEQRSVAILIDSDEEGKQRKLKIEAWAQRSRHECPVILLSRADQKPCSIEDFLEPDRYFKAVLAACKQAVEAGYVLPQRAEWSSELKRLLSTPDGKGGADQRTLGKRVETATSLIFGESISDNNIAIKYRERLDSKSESPGVPSSVSVYWESEDLTRLADTIWRTLKLPMRGEIKTLPFA
jgi:energy-coupling factor transporter ATP-binding protein EcfA2